MTMIAKVREWLETQGYSLEMKAASAFRAVGFEVRQSSYYTDTETNKPREIDVEVIDSSFLGLVDVRFFVECKSGDKPWVLFSSVDTLKGYNRLFAFGAMLKHARELFCTTDGIQLLAKYPWFKKDGVIAAYSLRQAFTKEVDSAYSAAMSAANACHYHVTADNSRFPRLHFAFPVIAVDAPLIRCFLDESGTVQLQEVDEGELLFTGHATRTCIRIVTLHSLPIFAQQAKLVAEMLKGDLGSEEKKMFGAMKPRG